MDIPIEKSAVDRRLEALENRIISLEETVEELHNELHRAVEPVRLAVIIHNSLLGKLNKQVNTGLEVTTLEGLFNLPSHEEPEAEPGV